MQTTTCIALMVASVLLLMGTSTEAGVVPPPHCSSDMIESLPPRLRKICAALYNIAEFSGVMEQFLDDKPYRENMPLIDSGVKRQDVDHVFLRFGRR